MAAATQIEMPVKQDNRPRFPPEFDLLRECCKPTPDSNRIAQRLPTAVDWELLLRLADRHRVLPALHNALLECEGVPGSIHSVLRARFHKNAVKALRFSAELARVVRALCESGIEVVAHKGPALAQFLYGDPALRQYGDLDVLIGPGDVAPAKSVLRQLGYESQLKLSPRQERAYLHSGYEYVFARGGERSVLELQWQIVPRFYAIDFDLQAIFQRSVEVQIEGFLVRSLCREDLMLVLCVHAAKHGWSQLGMLRDIANLAAFGVDWDCILAEARRIGIARILAISMLLGKNLLGCPVPEDLARESGDGTCTKLAAAVELKVSLSHETDPLSLTYFKNFARVRERWQDRVRFASRLAFTPSVGEWQTVRIPDALFPVYGAVRMGRLLRRALTAYRAT